MQFDVFLSCASASMPMAEKILRKFDAVGVKCWLTAISIGPGMDYSAAVAEAIKQCGVFVLILDEAANNSRQVMSEITYAVANKLKIVPLSLIDINEWTPQIKFALAKFQCIDATIPPVEESVDKLVSMVASLLGGYTAEKELKKRTSLFKVFGFNSTVNKKDDMVTDVAVNRTENGNAEKSESSLLKKRGNSELISPYEGEGKYIFISYRHKDNKRVFPVIAKLQEAGYAVWYDEGIDPGNEWDEEIAEHIQKSALMLAFISQNYIESDNCKDELNFARDEGIPRILIYLEDTELPAGMKMRLGRQQAIHYYGYEDKTAFYNKLFGASEIEKLPKKLIQEKSNDAINKAVSISTSIYMSFIEKDVKWANLFKEVLKNDGKRVTMASETIRGNVTELTETVKNSSAVLFVLSKEVLTDLRVIKELSTASEAKKPIIPVFVEDFELNAAFNYYLSNVAHIKAYDLKGRSLKVVVDAVKGILG